MMTRSPDAIKRTLSTALGAAGLIIADQLLATTKATRVYHGGYTIHMSQVAGHYVLRIG